MTKLFRIKSHGLVVTVSCGDQNVVEGCFYLLRRAGDIVMQAAFS